MSVYFFVDVHCRSLDYLKLKERLGISIRRRRVLANGLVVFQVGERTIRRHSEI